MIYVYIKNWWIIKKSENIVNWLSYDDVQQVNYKLTDKLIYDKWKIVKYEESEQYKKDKWIVWVEEERDIYKQKLKEKETQYNKLSCDFLRLRSEYDLLKKRFIP